MKLTKWLIAMTAVAGLGLEARAETITIATVNNGDMIRMQKLADDFTAKHPDIALEWVTLEENLLRQRVTTDIATKGGQYDVMTIGTYEVPIWGKQGWLVSLNDLPASYDVDDLLPAIRSGLTVEGNLFAAPFYGESSMVMYRTDLMKKAGLEMPKAPSWEFIGKAARAMTDKDNEIFGICLRGKAGWGENMAFLTATANSFGARWFDMDWKPQFDGKAWKTEIAKAYTGLERFFYERCVIRNLEDQAVWIRQYCTEEWSDLADRVLAGYSEDAPLAQLAEHSA